MGVLRELCPFVVKTFQYSMLRIYLSSYMFQNACVLDFCGYDVRMARLRTATLKCRRSY